MSKIDEARKITRAKITTFTVPANRNISLRNRDKSEEK